MGWKERDKDAGHSGYPTDITVSADHVYATGYGTTTGGTFGFQALSYALSGGPPAWETDTTGTTESGASAIAVAPGSVQVFVTGYLDGDYLTEAYSTA